MNQVTEQIVNIYKSMPLSRKILIGVMLVFIIIFFTYLIIRANRIDFSPLFGNLSTEDASEIVSKLKEKKISYRLENGGSVISVPVESVYETRLYLAGEGLPKGDNVGFEIFNKTDFGITEFVQKLNYQRALQGELARTIKQFDEVEDAKVMVVMPKESVFVEETKLPSVSVLLKLKSNFSKEKVAAVVHLVSSSIEGMTPELVTVVDTSGKVLTENMSGSKNADAIAYAQLNYKITFEKNLTQQIQSMLERMIGSGKAIVRVFADMDFNQVDTNEEMYDPNQQVIRSRQNVIESSDIKTKPYSSISSVNPTVPPGEMDETKETNQSLQKQNETLNYEISRTIRKIVKPVAVLKRISVAAVLDGNYEIETDANNNQIKKYVPRTEEELNQFTKIVQKAMGYNEDREDQVLVESFPFSHIDDISYEDSDIGKTSWQLFISKYGFILSCALLVLLISFFIVRPVTKTAKELQSTVLLEQEEKAKLQELEEQKSLPEIEEEKTPKQKVANHTDKNLGKASNIIKRWLNEAPS